MSQSVDEDDGVLKDLVSRTLQNNGVLGKIQAQLRASVFLALEEEFKERDISLCSTVSRKVLATPAGRLAASLVHDFFTCLGLDFSLSVYGPESNLGAGLWKLHTHEDMLKELHLLEKEKDPSLPVLHTLCSRGSADDVDTTRQDNIFTRTNSSKSTTKSQPRQHQLQLSTDATDNTSASMGITSSSRLAVSKDTNTKYTRSADNVCASSKDTAVASNNCCDLTSTTATATLAVGNSVNNNNNSANKSIKESSREPSEASADPNKSIPKDCVENRGIIIRESQDCVGSNNKNKNNKTMNSSSSTTTFLTPISKSGSSGIPSKAPPTLSSSSQLPPADILSAGTPSTGSTDSSSSSDPPPLTGSLIKALVAEDRSTDTESTSDGSISHRSLDAGEPVYSDEFSSEGNGQSEVSGGLVPVNQLIRGSRSNNSQDVQSSKSSSAEQSIHFSNQCQTSKPSPALPADASNTKLVTSNATTAGSQFSHKATTNDKFPGKVDGGSSDEQVVTEEDLSLDFLTSESSSTRGETEDVSAATDATLTGVDYDEPL